METVTQQEVIDACMAVVHRSGVSADDKANIIAAIHDVFGSTQRNEAFPSALRPKLAAAVFTTILRGIDACNPALRTFSERKPFDVLKGEVRVLIRLYDEDSEPATA